jgi:dTDP-4-dehydrorhamnose reductase
VINRSIQVSIMGKPETILIAGKNGRVARDLVEAADRLGLAVTALGRPDLDLNDRESIARVLAAQAPSAIVNAAGLVLVDEAERDPARAFAINCDGAAYLAAAAAGAGIPLVHLSSDYVFDGAKMAPYREDDPRAPLSVYGRSKAAGEEAVLDAHPQAFVVRTSWVYGPQGNNFLTTMLRLAEVQDVVRVVADQHGTPTAGADLAGALLEMIRQVLAEQGEASPGIYHVAGSGETTWLGFAEAIFSGWARRGHRVPNIQAIAAADWPGPARRPRDSRLDCSKVTGTFGIRLPDWKDSLDRCLDLVARQHQDALGAAKARQH